MSPRKSTATGPGKSDPRGIKGYVDPLARTMVVALLDLLEEDAELRDRARRILDTAPALAYVSRAQARAMGVETRALIRAERTGELTAYKAGRAKVYRRADVQRFVEAHAASASAPVDHRPAVEDEPDDTWSRALARRARRARAAP